MPALRLYIAWLFCNPLALTLNLFGVLSAASIELRAASGNPEIWKSLKTRVRAAWARIEPDLVQFEVLSMTSIETRCRNHNSIRGKSSVEFDIGLSLFG